MTKILIVEDQIAPLETLEYALQKVAPKYFTDYSVEVARCYEEAQRMIPLGYDFVLLDHRMPLAPVGDLEDTDLDRFCKSLKEVGYSLIDQIKGYDPKMVIIGTSSLSPTEIKVQSTPDYIMSKMWGKAETDLDRILSEVGERK
ncbi:MAG: hypothetical protein WCV90_02355 [Candidatus Woesearchaeota archaeon]|jgi:CheY-like chemotaxis protein